MLFSSRLVLGCRYIVDSNTGARWWRNRLVLKEWDGLFGSRHDIIIAVEGYHVTNAKKKFSGLGG